MALTPVTITHDFDLPDAAGGLGVVEFTVANPDGMHNGSKTVSGTRRAVLAAGGLLSQQVYATTDPGTTPLGVPYRIVVRITGQPVRTYYAQIPHDQGATLDLATLLEWAASAGPGSLPGAGGGTGGDGTGGGTGTTGYSPVDMNVVGGTIIPDATLGWGPHRHTAVFDPTFAAPTGGKDGQPLEAQVTAFGTSRILTIGGAPTTIPADGMWIGQLRYVGARDAWELIHEAIVGPATSDNSDIDDPIPASFTTTF